MPKRRSGKTASWGLTCSFTLIEVMILVAVVPIIAGTLLTLSTAHGRLFDETQARSELHNQLSLTLQLVGATARLADGVVGSRTINGAQYDSASDTLILSLPSLDAAGKPMASTHDYVVFYRDPADATRLRASLESDASSSRKSWKKLLTNGVRNVRFVLEAAEAGGIDSLLIDLECTRRVRAADIVLKADSAFSLVNKQP